jgi:hypothetical protein
MQTDAGAPRRGDLQKPGNIVEFHAAFLCVGILTAWRG